MKTHPKLEALLKELKANPRTWLVTGAAGFVGSHLVEELLLLGQTVVGLDNFSNANRSNLLDVEAAVGPMWKYFTFVEGDICDFETCLRVCTGVDIVLHQAALGSVPRSIENPIRTNQSNVTGFLNMIAAAKESSIGRFVFASSSSVYGNDLGLPKVEERIGQPLSPYAVSKVTNELYAKTFSEVYGIDCVGLRYFNVFGARQLANSPYAAVIPNWITRLLKGDVVQIFGDGSVSRDFCYVKNVVQMNLLAATTTNRNALNRVFNTACNRRISLNEVFESLAEIVREKCPELPPPTKMHLAPRKGDIQHSQARISDAELHLGYEPLYFFQGGLQETMEWFLKTKPLLSNSELKQKRDGSPSLKY